MRLKRRIATLLAFIMAFSSVAAFGVSADSFAPAGVGIVPMAAGDGGIFPTAAVAADGTAGINQIVLVAASPATTTVPSATGVFGTLGAFWAWFNAIPVYIEGGRFHLYEIITSGTAGARQVLLPAGGTDAARTEMVNLINDTVTSRFGSLPAYDILGAVPTTIEELEIAYVGGPGTDRNWAVWIDAQIEAATNTFITTGAVTTYNWMLPNAAQIRGQLDNEVTGMVVWDPAAASGAGDWVAATAPTYPITGMETIIHALLEAHVTNQTATTTTNTAPPIAGITTEIIEAFPGANGGIFVPVVDALVWNRPINVGQVAGINIAQPLVSTDRWYNLVDRHSLATMGGVPGRAQGAPANRPIIQAPELRIEAGQVSPNMSFTLDLSGWSGNGNSNPWRAAFNGFGLTPVNIVPNATSFFTVANVDLLPEPQFAGWTQINQDVWAYSGMRGGVIGGRNTLHEVPFQISFAGERATITVPNNPAFTQNAILRLPIIVGNGTAGSGEANQRTVPTLTLNGIGLTDHELPFAHFGAGITTNIGHVRTGRNFVNMDDLNLVEPVLNSLRNNGHLRLTLPWGYRWDPLQVITASIGAENQPIQVFIPSHDPAGIQRDGNQAQSMLVIQFGNIVQPHPGNIQPRTLSIHNLRIVPPTGMTLPQFGDVNVTIAGGAVTAVNTHATLWPTSGTFLANLTNLYAPTVNALPIGDIPTSQTMLFTGATPSSLHVATFSDHSVVFDTLDGVPGNVTTIAAGWLGANARTTGRAGSVGGAGAMTAFGNAVGAQHGNTATVELREVVPISGWFEHDITFSIVDAAGEIIPYVAVERVHFQTTSAESGMPWGRLGEAQGWGQRVTGTGAAQTNIQFGVSGTFANRLSEAHNWTPWHATTAGVGYNAGPMNSPNYPLVGTVSGVTFLDAQRVAVNGIHLSEEAMRRGDTRILYASFVITADVNWSGDVYLAVEGPALVAGGVVGNISNPQVHIATVRPSLIVDTQNTTVQIGFQELDVADITITEYAVGDFRTNTTLNVSLGEYGVGNVAHNMNNMLFVPIPAGRITQHITIGGSNVPQQRVIAHLQPFTMAQATLPIAIQRNTLGDVPSYIHLSGLQVRTSRNVPYGSYELVLRGSTVLNNERFMNINQVGATTTWQTVWVNQLTGVVSLTVQTGADWFVSQRQITTGAVTTMPNQVGYRRYSFGPLMYMNYVNVETPGGYGAGSGPIDGGADDVAVDLPTIVVPHLPSATFTVDGASRTHYGGSQSVNITPGQNVNGVQVIAGRLYVPLRSIVEVGLGGEVSWIPGPAGGSEGSAVTGTLNGRTAIFPVGSLTFYDYLGRTIPAPYGMAAFIGNGTVGQAGRTYVPLRSIALAFGLELDGMGAGGTAAVLN